MTTRLGRSPAVDAAASRVSIENRDDGCEVQIASAGVSGGCLFFSMAAALGFFTLLLVLNSLADPDQPVVRYAAAGCGILGLSFFLAGVDAARRKGRISLSRERFEIIEAGLFRRRRWAVRPEDILEIAVADSNTEIDERPVQALAVVSVDGSRQFFKYVQNAELKRIAKVLNAQMRETEAAKGQSAASPILPRAPVTRKRTLAGFLLACAPVIVLFGFASFISWVARINTIELSKDSDHLVRCVVRQRLLLLFELSPRYVERLADVKTQGISTRDPQLILAGSGKPLIVPGDEATARRILAFMSDPEEQSQTIWVGNPLTEFAAFVFAALGAILLVLILGHTLEPILAWHQVPTRKVHLADAVGALSEKPIHPSQPLAIYAEQVRLLRVLDWQPKRRLRFISARPLSWNLAGIVFCGLLGVLPCWLLTGFWIRPLSEFVPIVSDRLQWLIYALPGGYFGYLFISHRSPSRRIDFDLLNEKVTWQVGTRSRTGSLHDIKGLLIRPVREAFSTRSSVHRRSVGQTTKVGYRSRLEMCLPSGDVTILDTERAFHLYDDKAAPVKALEPLANWIARQLTVKLRTGLTVDDPKFFASFWGNHKFVSIGFLAICLIFVGHVINTFVQSELRRRQIAKFGGSLSEYSYSIKDDVVIAKGRLYDFGNEALTDAQFTRLAPMITSDRAEVALSLENTSITNRSIALLRDNTRIKMLNLTGCAINDECAEAIGSLGGLIDLQLVDTRLSDVGLRSLGQLRRLRYLSLGSRVDSEITDHGMAQLHELTNLRQLYLRNTHVSQEGLAKLRQALPKLEITIPSF